MQTAGKTYLARPDNIEKFTSGRFAPHRQLAETAEALSEPPIGDHFVLPVLREPNPELKTGLLITDEDLSVINLTDETPGSANGFRTKVTPPAWASMAALRTTHLLSPGDVASSVCEFVDGLLDDAVYRSVGDELSRGVNRLHSPTHQALVAALVQWAESQQLQQVVTPCVPTGPTAEVVTAARPALHAKGIELVMLRRQWDDEIWPHCSKGFFALKKKIPSVLDELKLLNGPQL